MRRTNTLSPLTLGLRLVAVLAVALVLAACPAPQGARSTATPETSEEATAEPTSESTDEATPEATEEPGGEGGDFPTPEEEDLLAHVPESIRDSCERVEFWFPDAETEIICYPEGAESEGLDNVAYAQYPDTEAMDAAFDETVETSEAVEGDCAAEGAFYGPYSIGEEEEVGRVLCDAHASSAYMMWTDERLDILSSASREDADMEALYAWWGGDSGPIE